jgi:hypothetical protein
MQKEENKLSLDQQAEDLIGLLEHFSPNMVTHDGSSAPRQYYESIKKQKGKVAAIGALKVIIMNYDQMKSDLEETYIKPIEEAICAEKEKLLKSRSQQ